MKSLKTLFIPLLTVIFALTSCERPSGPPGVDGFNGRDGENGSPQTVIFEIADVSLTSADNFTIGRGIPTDISIGRDDLVLIYRQNGEINNNDVWQLLPQNFFLDQGTFQYNFSHTSKDYDIFIDSDFDLATLTSDQVSSFLQGQIFRIAVIPAAPSPGAKVLNQAYEYDTISEDALFLNFTE